MTIGKVPSSTAAFSFIPLYTRSTGTKLPASCPLFRRRRRLTAPVFTKWRRTAKSPDATGAAARVSTGYRLQKAKSLLETSDLKVSEVAWKVGYKDVSHFSRSFHEMFGFSPGTKIN